MVEVGTGSLDGVAPSRMVGVSASVNLPLCHKVQKFSSGTGSHGWSQKKGRKMVVVEYDITYNDKTKIGLFSTITWVSRHQKVNHSGFYCSKR